MNTESIKRYLRNTRLRISLPFLSYEINLDDVLTNKDVDERIKRLSQIKNDLQDTVGAVEQLQAEALHNKAEADRLRETVAQLKQDKATTETMMKIPEESLARVVARAGSKGRIRGLIEGLVIGLITGAISSYFVWFITTPKTKTTKPAGGAYVAPAADAPSAHP